MTEKAGPTTQAPEDGRKAQLVQQWVQEERQATTPGEREAAYLRFTDGCAAAGLMQVLRPDENPRDAKRLYWLLRP